MLSKSGRSVLLNFLSGMFEIFTGPVSGPTTHRTGDEGHCGKQQQNDSFGHNH
jgi:hypothetical protein